MTIKPCPIGASSNFVGDIACHPPLGRGGSAADGEGLAPEAILPIEFFHSVFQGARS